MEEEAGRCQTGQWPHQHSFLLASLGCLLGMAGLSRFVTLTLHFGGEKRRKTLLWVRRERVGGSGLGWVAGGAGETILC